MKLNIHEKIYKKLENFIETNRIPNLLFHGESGSGKRTIVYDFIDMVYKTNERNLMNVDCAKGSGIKFIREKLKFFAKSNTDNLKIILLTNADKLTIDAQSALRRCIELFSNTTRFIIIIQNKEKLLNPILSRFSHIYVPYTKHGNLHILTANADFKTNYNRSSIVIWNLIKKNENNITKLTENIYDNGYSGIDVLNAINKYDSDNNIVKINYLYNAKSCFKCEKLFIFYILNMYIRSEDSLENINNL